MSDLSAHLSRTIVLQEDRSFALGVFPTLDTRLSHDNISTIIQSNCFKESEKVLSTLHNSKLIKIKREYLNLLDYEILSFYNVNAYAQAKLFKDQRRCKAR